MMNADYEKMKQCIMEALSQKTGFDQDQSGCFSYEIYPDYRDEMDNATAVKILASEDPMQSFWEQLDEWYFDYEIQLRTEVENEVRTELTSDNGPYPQGFTPDEKELFEELMGELVYFLLPEKHFLDQSFRVNIMVDTGDGNYDYVLNSVYPCWYGSYDQKIDDRAGIVWLAKTQGYTKGQLWNVLRKGDMSTLKGFLESMRVEVANISSHMNTVTFLVEMPLKDLMELNRLIKLQERNGRFYDARKNPYCGYIIIEKTAETGLYDPWNGGGSVFEIELERDVKLPVKYIRSALPDGGDGYSIEGVYGMCGSAWKEGGVKHIHAPLAFPA